MIRLILAPLFVLLTLNVCAQTTGTIKGKISTSDGHPAAYVSVGLKNKNLGSTSNEEGYYTIKMVKPGQYTLKVSAVGSKSVEKQIKVQAGEELNVDFIIVQSSDELKEINIRSNARNKFATKKSEYVSKMSLTNLENPQVYTTVSKELMGDQLVFSVDDATRNVPGLQKMWEATSRAGDGGGYYSSRGFIVQSKMRNGVAGNISTRIDAANLERLEVIKGPSATLFGSTLTSYGGLINRVTKKPYEGTGGEVTYSRGSYDFERVAVDFNAPVSKSDQIYMRVNAAYNYEGSFQDSGFDKSFFLAPSLSYKVNDRLDLNFDAEISSGRNVPKQIIFFYFPASQLGYDRADQVGLDYRKSYMSNDLLQVYNNANIFAQATYKISKKWTSQTNITHTYSYSNGRSPYFFLAPDNIAVPGLPASPKANYLSRADQSTENGKAKVTEIQQNFNGEFNIGQVKNKIVVGLDYMHSNSNILFYSTNKIDVINFRGSMPNYNNFNAASVAAYYALNRTNPDSVSNFLSKSINNIYSAYVSDAIGLTDRLTALAALRVDRFENINNEAGAATGNNPAYKQTAFSPKFGLVFQPVKDQVSIFGNYQNSFTNQQGTDVKGNTFKPEQANQLEGGVKLDVFKGKLSGTISYYYIKVKDVLRTDPTNPNFRIQDGGKISKGIEFELNANPFQGFNILTGFGYNENHFVNASEDVEGRRDGSSMSPYSANLWLSYKLPSGYLKGLGVGFGGNYASDNKIVNTTTSVFTLPKYTVLNASVFYDHPKFRIGAKVDNLTNKEYWIGYTTMNAQKLRSFVGSISYKF
ncbi:hypothetical protein TH53_19545 [Pedobacter lusitanus]|uniref:TonB-dependent siderophore receptor n=1 Tax=Pedobacter lusitanus TaxID=1503925 RepID=A0A0D0GED0_9SPHI|nr:TonB-dependent receptor [Pedobacter lusitanus]KIO75677.1 hypothetical protein TH53_19545 [Pedobacter lusitanus]